MKAYSDENSLNGGNVVLELSTSEALVFYDWLRRRNEGKVEPLLLPAEQRVLWDIECMFEKSLVAPFRADYDNLLKRARASIEG